MAENEKSQKLIDLICGESGGGVCRLAVNQLVLTMEKTCEMCMRDRRILVLDPLCRDRFYLSLLIEAGVSADEIPKDCYNMRLEEIRKLLDGRMVPLSVHDAVMRIKDFIKILVRVFRVRGLSKKIRGASQKNELMEILRSIVEKTRNIGCREMDDKTIVVVYRNKPIINVIDFSRRIVYVNLDERRPDADLLRGLIDLLINKYGVSGRLYESVTGNIYLQLDISDNLDVVKTKNVLRGIGVAILDNNNKKILSVRIVEEGDVAVTFSQIVDLIRLMTGMSGESGE